MRLAPVSSALSLALAFVGPPTFLTGCITDRYGDKPVAEVGQPDTLRFRMYVNAFAAEGTAWERLKPDIDEYQRANGYVSYVVVNRMYAPQGYFEYSIKFSR